MAKTSYFKAMKLTKKDKELLINLIKDKISDIPLNIEFDFNQLNLLMKKLSLSDKQKLSESLNIDWIIEQIKPHFPEEIFQYSWKKEIIDLIDIDGKEFNEIIRVIIWARKHPFWTNQFLSLKKLRKKDNEEVKYYDKFLYQMNHENKNIREYSYTQVCNMVSNEGFKMNQFKRMPNSNFYIKIN